MGLRKEMELWISEAKDATLADVVEIINHGLKRSGPRLAGPCPQCAGTDRLWADLGKNRWGCRGCRPLGGSAIDFVQHFEGGDFIATCASITGRPSPNGKDGGKISEAELQKRRDKIEQSKQRREREAAASELRRIENASGIWLASDPLGGAPAEYLRRRGINPDFADDQIRAHCGLRHPSGQSFPALVARVCGPGGEGTGIWRIYCKVDGSGKAPVDDAKLGLGIARGGSVRIGGTWPTIAVTEGIETALAVRELTGGKIPVWAALSTSGMAGLVVPAEVERVDIYADADPPKSPKGARKCWMASPGIAAANELKKRLEAEGRQVTVQLPPLGTDWLQVLQANKKVEAA